MLAAPQTRAAASSSSKAATAAGIQAAAAQLSSRATISEAGAARPLAPRRKGEGPHRQLPQGPLTGPLLTTERLTLIRHHHQPPAATQMMVPATQRLLVMLPSLLATRTWRARCSWQRRCLRAGRRASRPLPSAP